MRVRLTKEKQRELIERSRSKAGISWSKFGALLNFNAHYLSHELRDGLRTLPIPIYKQLCAIADENYDDHIVEILPSNWGQKEGGKRSGGGKPKRAKILSEKSENLAEIIGVVLGDGHLEESHKLGHYAVKISGGLDDLEYLADFVAPLFRKLFGKQMKSLRFKKAKGVMFYIYDKNIVCTMEHYGLKPGNKKNNNARIPEWILSKDEYLRACLRGLFDTDGTVFPKSANSKIPQLELTSKIEGVQETFRRGLLQLGFMPSKWSKSVSPKCGLYAREQVMAFRRRIGFHNPKHERRFEKILSKK